MAHLNSWPVPNRQPSFPVPSKPAGQRPWAPGYGRLMAAMLGEAAMHEHKSERATVWLAAMLPVLQVQAGCWHLIASLLLRL